METNNPISLGMITFKDQDVTEAFFDPSTRTFYAELDGGRVKEFSFEGLRKTVISSCMSKIEIDWKAVIVVTLHHDNRLTISQRHIAQQAGGKVIESYGQEKENYYASDILKVMPASFPYAAGVWDSRNDEEISIVLLEHDDKLLATLYKLENRLDELPELILRALSHPNSIAVAEFIVEKLQEIDEGLNP